MTLVIPLMIFGLYDNVLLPSLNVSDGSPKEVLSIPVMQVARVIRDKSEVFTDEDKSNINAVFNFEMMEKRYDPSISDDVKNEYKIDTTSDDMKLFFDVWFKYLKKYPNIYVESFVNSTYWYFYPYGNRDELYLAAGWGRVDDIYGIDCIPMFSIVPSIIKKVVPQIIVAKKSDSLASVETLLIFI